MNKIMKTIQAGLMLGLVLVQSQAIAEELDAKAVGKLVERNGIRTLIYERSEKTAYFYLEEQGYRQLLREVEFQGSAVNLSLAGDTNPYEMEINKKTLNASKQAYLWCFVDGVKDIDLCQPYQLGAAFWGAGIIGSIGLCATVPGLPALAGFLMAPIDGFITAMDKLFDIENVAKRKFEKAMKGKTVKVSTKAFDSVLTQVSKL